MNRVLMTLLAVVFGAHIAHAQLTGDPTLDSGGTSGTGVTDVPTLNPEPDPGIDSPDGTPSGGDSDCKCCSCKTIPWFGAFPKVQIAGDLVVKTVKPKNADPDKDLWSGDDECYQKAISSLVFEKNRSIATATAEAYQYFEMVDWLILTVETGFPAGHVHPSADVRGEIVWSYPGNPEDSDPRNRRFPGMKLDITLVPEVEVSVEGYAHLPSSSSSSSGAAVASTEVFHPCMEMNPVGDSGEYTAAFVCDRNVSGKCAKDATVKEWAKATAGGEVGVKAKADEEPEFTGSLEGIVSWGKEVQVQLGNDKFMISHTTPLRTIVLAGLATDEPEVRMQFRCHSHVSNDGNCNDMHNPWLHYSIPGIARGSATASARLHVSSRQLLGCVEPAL
ncbi:MAG: hypothetical protein KDA96_04060 [Planctomycetaceae bacterium]|nr:hypothetical protein [Planctomycetaceae bacterium]